MPQERISPLFATFDEEFDNQETAGTAQSPLPGLGTENRQAPRYEPPVRTAEQVRPSIKVRPTDPSMIVGSEQGAAEQQTPSPAAEAPENHDEPAPVQQAAPSVSSSQQEDTGGAGSAEEGQQHADTEETEQKEAPARKTRRQTKKASVELAERRAAAEGEASPEKDSAASGTGEERADAEDVRKMSIHRQLVAIQQELVCPKQHRNESGTRGFSYRSLNDIQIAVAPLLAKYGCRMNFRTTFEETPRGAVFCIAVCSITNEAGEELNATAYSREPDELGDMNLPQISGSAQTYACKYAAGNLLNINDTKIESPGEVDSLRKPASTERREKKILYMGSADWTLQTERAKGYNGEPDVFLQSLELQYDEIPDKERGILTAYVRMKNA